MAEVADAENIIQQSDDAMDTSALERQPMQLRSRMIAASGSNASSLRGALADIGNSSSNSREKVSGNSRPSTPTNKSSAGASSEPSSSTSGGAASTAANSSSSKSCGSCGSSSSKCRKHVSKTYQDKSSFSGVICSRTGKRWGHGTFVNRHGDKYEGEWADDKRSGRGTYTWKSGDVYEGEWMAGTMEGQGNFKWANGDSYRGQWKVSMLQSGICCLLYVCPTQLN